MEYNDFNIMADYESMAKEYYSHMKGRGYVFMRVDDNADEKVKIIKQILSVLAEMLSGYRAIEMFLKKNEKDFLKRLCFLTENQFEKLQDMYSIGFENQNIKQQNIKKVISKEALLLDRLLKLMLLETDENFILIKNMIFERLKILQED